MIKCCTRTNRHSMCQIELSLLSFIGSKFRKVNLLCLFQQGYVINSFTDNKKLYVLQENRTQTVLLCASTILVACIHQV